MELCATCNMPITNTVDKYVVIEDAFFSEPTTRGDTVYDTISFGKVENHHRACWKATHGH